MTLHFPPRYRSVPQKNVQLKNSTKNPTSLPFKPESNYGQHQSKICQTKRVIKSRGNTTHLLPATAKIPDYLNSLVTTFTPRRRSGFATRFVQRRWASVAASTSSRDRRRTDARISRATTRGFPFGYGLLECKNWARALRN